MLFVVIHAFFTIYVNSIPPTIDRASMPYTMEIKHDRFLLITLVVPLIIPDSAGIPVFSDIPFIAMPNVFGIIFLVVFWFLIYWLFILMFFKTSLKISKIMRK